MDKLTKVILLFIGLGILINILKKSFFSQKKQEIIVDGHRVDKGLCMYAMNQLYGRGLDSSKICDCMIPKFYELIKHDPSKVKKFEEVGLFTLESPLNDSVIVLFGNCASQNMADTTFIVDLEKFKEPFLIKLSDTLEYYDEFQAYNMDSAANCIFQNLNGKLTIKEFLAEDYMKVEKIRNTMENCLGRNIRN